MAELETNQGSKGSNSLTGESISSDDLPYTVHSWKYKSAVSDYISGEGITLKDEIDTEDVEKIYKRDLLAHREVKKENEDIFKHAPEVKSDSEKLESEIKDLLYGELDLWNKLQKAFLGAQLDSTSLLYFNYVDDTEEISEEPKNISDIVQIGIIYRTNIVDYDWEDDIEKENFGEIKAWKYKARTKTKSYEDKRLGRDTGSQTIERWIHTDRVMHVKYDDFKNDPYGISKIEPGFNYHIYRQSVVESMVLAYYLNASGIKMFQPPEDATPQEIEWLKNNVESMREKAELVAPHGTKVEHPAPQTTDPSPYLSHLMEAGFSMPYTILTGVQAGQVTGSETNLKLYYREVQNTRVNNLGILLKNHLLKLQEKGALSEGEFELEWGDIFELDEEARSNILLRRANAAGDLFQLGLINKEEARELSGLKEEFGGSTIMLDEDREEKEEGEEEEETYRNIRDFDFEIQQDEETAWDDLSDEERRNVLGDLEVYNPNRDIERFSGESHIWLADYTDRFLERVKEIINESNRRSEMISKISEIGAMDYGQFKNVLKRTYETGYTKSHKSVRDRVGLIRQEEEEEFEDIADEEDKEELESEKELMANRTERQVRDNYKLSALGILRDEEIDNEYGAVEKEIEDQMETESNRLDTIISTEMMMAVGMGLALAYKRAGKRQVIWIALMDDRTCEECMDLDGTVMSIDRARGILPLHPNCRCSLIAEDEYDEVVQRL